MSIHKIAVVVFAFAFYTTLVAAECSSATNQQIAQVRDAWISAWNAGQLDNVTKLYAQDAAFLGADGSRATGQNEIRAAFQKQIGGKVSVQSVTLDCSGEISYDSGTYTEDIPGGATITGGVTITGGATITGNGHREGNYLVVLKRQSGKWLIVQHASTAKR